VVLIFSYLYCVMVLFNVITRSTLASLLLTMLVWISLFTLHTTTDVLAMFLVIGPEMRNEGLVRDLAMYDRQIALAVEEGDTERIGVIEQRRTETQEDFDHNVELLARGRQFYGAARMAIYLLPKSSLTTQLLSRRLLVDTGFESTSEVFDAFAGMGRGSSDRSDGADGVVRYESSDRPYRASSKSTDMNDPEWQQEVGRRLEKMQLKQSPTFIISTSLAFEAVILGIALIIFNRREW
jgi:hypothetical protein